MASLVPEPIEKCAVCSASPSSTALSKDQSPFFTSRKLIHLELLERSGLLFRSFAKTRRTYSRVSSSLIVANPALSHVRGSHSTMNVLVVLLNLYEWAAKVPASFSRNVSVRPWKSWFVPYQM